mmetsp:Transcript_167090/g.536596  ORF Transcript_167090/g.536596 Transcript_167090/m.536596 type:complete len:221 (+) Transcript_167090:1549-2211(+)
MLGAVEVSGLHGHPLGLQEPAQDRLLLGIRHGRVRQLLHLHTRHDLELRVVAAVRIAKPSLQPSTEGKRGRQVDALNRQCLLQVVPNVHGEGMVDVVQGVLELLLRHAPEDFVHRRQGALTEPEARLQVVLVDPRRRRIAGTTSSTAFLLSLLVVVLHPIFPERGGAQDRPKDVPPSIETRHDLKRWRNERVDRNNEDLWLQWRTCEQVLDGVAVVHGGM